MATASRMAFLVSLVVACGGARNPYDVPVAPPPVTAPPQSPPNAEPPPAYSSEPMEPLDPGPPLGDLPQLPPPGSSATAPDGLPVVTAPSNGGTSRSLTPDQIRRVVAAHTGAIRACYARALVDSPNASGKVVLGWRIEANGTTSDVSVKSSTLKLPKTEACMVQQVQRWKFPSADAPVVLSYPFVLARP